VFVADLVVVWANQEQKSFSATTVLNGLGRILGGDGFESVAMEMVARGAPKNMKVILTETVLQGRYLSMFDLAVQRTIRLLTSAFSCAKTKRAIFGGRLYAVPSEMHSFLFCRSLCTE